MISTGSGKTTLLDVLSGRKNTGTIKGRMCLNGAPKNDKIFRKISGYVEQVPPPVNANFIMTEYYF